MEKDPQILLDALKRIAKPEGAWNRDMEVYFKNIINNCIEIAEEAIKKWEAP